MFRTLTPPSPSIAFRDGTTDTRSSFPPAGAKIAIVDDDELSRRVLRGMLGDVGLDVVEFRNGGDALRSRLEDVAVICVDLGLEDMPGLEVIQHLHAKSPHISVLVVSGRHEIASAVETIQAGAYDYLTKPFDIERVQTAVRRGIERWALSMRVSLLENVLDARGKGPVLVGRSAAMKSLVQQVDRVVDSDVTVCLLGESGTGKELVAQAIHAKSPRAQGPFVALNCAAIPPTLQESELFGHERGAFTGAVQTYKGRFEQAKGGVLFLDEIGEMSLGTQATLLRTLQEKTIRRVGGANEIPVDARIVCATHRDLRAEVKAGHFREDLYFRLVVYPIELPPLRARRADVPMLVGYFLRKLAVDVGRPVQRIEPDALEALMRYRWPGNVRELQNAIHRAMLSCSGVEIELGDLPPEIASVGLHSLPPPPAPSAMPTGVATASQSKALLADGEVITLADLERRAIDHALRATKGNVGQAAKLLGLGRTTLYRKLSSMGLHVAMDEER